MLQNIFLDELLKSGANIASKSQEVAEDKLQIPSEGVARDAQIDGLKKGAMAAGVLALLLGTKTGRKVSGSALKIGSLAAIGGIGYKAYQNWVSEKNTAEQEYQDITNDIGKHNKDKRTLVDFEGMNAREADAKSQALLKAMIAAAKADGHVDSNEVDAIEEQITKLGLSDEAVSLIQSEIEKPLDVKEIALLATDQAMAAEIYLVSAIIIDRENVMEREYLDALTKEMGLPSGLVSHLNKVKEES